MRSFFHCSDVSFRFTMKSDSLFVNWTNDYSGNSQWRIQFFKWSPLYNVKISISLLTIFLNFQMGERRKAGLGLPEFRDSAIAEFRPIAESINTRGIGCHCWVCFAKNWQFSKVVVLPTSWYFYRRYAPYLLLKHPRNSRTVKQFRYSKTKASTVIKPADSPTLIPFKSHRLLTFRTARNFPFPLSTPCGEGDILHPTPRIVHPTFYSWRRHCPVTCHWR